MRLPRCIYWYILNHIYCIYTTNHVLQQSCSCLICAGGCMCATIPISQRTHASPPLDSIILYCRQQSIILGPAREMHVQFVHHQLYHCLVKEKYYVCVHDYCHGGPYIVHAPRMRAALCMAKYSDAI
jgi:hypothetical protein